MGVLGLWKLIDPSGKPVPLETLEGKILAIDVSIWLHQVVQGYQDRKGSMLTNAHLIGLFNRICKLMYFKIKPVFVFDGGVPLLKKNTIAHRRKLKSIATTKAQKLKNDLINNLIKHTAVSGALDKGHDGGESSSSSQLSRSASLPDSLKEPDMYKLPEIPSVEEMFAGDGRYYHSDDDKELSPKKQTKWIGNIHSVNVDTEEFRNLPADVRYDILNDLKDTRKQNSWGKIHKMPAESNDYSGFQLERLRKRRLVQESLEKAEKEMGGKTFTLEELEQLLTEQGINTNLKDDAYRIASDCTTRVIYINQPGSSQENEAPASGSELIASKMTSSDNNDSASENSSHSLNKSDAMIHNLEEYSIDDEFWESDDSFNDSIIPTKSDLALEDANPAFNYMLEYSGLTKEGILSLIEQSKKNKKLNEGSIKKSKKTGKTRVSKKTPKKIKSLITPLNQEESLEQNDIREENASCVNDSTSESDNFVEVSEKNEDDCDKTIIKLESSDSDSDDFVEIKDVPIPEVPEPKSYQKTIGLEIRIKADEVVEDDIFADVFSDVTNEKKEIPNSIPNVKQEIQDTISLNEILKIELKPVTEVKNISNSTKLQSDSYESQNVSEIKSLSFDEKNSHPCLDIGILDTTERKVEIFSSREIDNDIIIKSTQETENSSSSQIDDKIIPAAESEDRVQEQNKVNINETIESGETVDNSKKQNEISLPVDEKELNSMKDKLESEQKDIQNMIGKLERQAVDLTDQMRIEAQELLRLFGVPYIVAPMEAEAQCAYLEQLGLTHGTITDDSDIWLFGGKCVYKNFFDNNKRVLQFLADDIQKHFNLTREELIQLALLVGSDYTNGLTGVGPVTALEIMAAFPAKGQDILSGLKNFRYWLGCGTLKAPEKMSLRNKLKNVHLEKAFPSQTVVQAYIDPTVDTSEEPFSWSKPNMVLLSDYVRKKFGWTKMKFDEIMNPVLKKMSETQSQSSISSYFKIHVTSRSVEEKLSKRVQTAVQKLSGKIENETGSMQDSIQKLKSSQQTSKNKKKMPKSTTLPSKSDTESNDEKIPDTSDQDKCQGLDKDGKIDIKIKRKPRPRKPKNGTESAETITSTSVSNEDQRLSPNVDSGPSTSDVVPLKKKRAEGKPIRKVVLDEVIPQREKDKVNSLKAKLHAIEVFRKSKRGLNRLAKNKKSTPVVLAEAKLSESSDSSDS